MLFVVTSFVIITILCLVYGYFPGLVGMGNKGQRFLGPQREAMKANNNHIHPNINNHYYCYW